MNRILFTMAMVICMVALLVGVQTVSAELIAKDSADFTWKYEMDSDPASQDLDDNSVNDWSLLRGAPSFSGGILTMGYDSGSGVYACYLSNANADNSIWSNISNSTGYTFEMKVQSDGTRYWNTYHGGMYIRPSDDNDSENFSDLVIVNERTLWDTNTAITTIDTNANNDDYHVFRIAQEANSSKYYVWRDGDLIWEGDGLSPKNAAAKKNRIQFGDMGGAGGPCKVDYVRLIAGGYAPIPEPSTLALLASGLLGLLAYAWRKRK